MKRKGKQESLNSSKEEKGVGGRGRKRKRVRRNRRQKGRREEPSMPMVGNHRGSLFLPERL